MNLEEIQAWVRAAIIDDWRVTHPLSSDKRIHLERDGFVAHATLRERDHSLMVWGGDGLVIDTPNPYSWRACLQGLRRCERCPDYVGKTERAYFANRVCPKCAEALAEDTDRYTKD